MVGGFHAGDVSLFVGHGLFPISCSCVASLIGVAILHSQRCRVRLLPVFVHGGLCVLAAFFSMCLNRCCSVLFVGAVILRAGVGLRVAGRFRLPWRFWGKTAVFPSDVWVCLCA